MPMYCRWQPGQTVIDATSRCRCQTGGDTAALSGGNTVDHLSSEV